jgi:hypothetical protein
MWVNNGSTFDDIFSKILSHEKEVNNSSTQSISSIDHGLVVHTQHESVRCVRCKSTGHPVELCTRKICLHCKQNGKHGIGHDKSECYTLKRSNNDSPHSHHHSSNTKKFKLRHSKGPANTAAVANVPKNKINFDYVLVTENTDDTIIDSVVTVTSNQEFTTRDTWIIDSGCSLHICKNLNYFMTYKQLSLNDQVPIRAANGSTIISKGIGTVSLQLPGQQIVQFKNVHYVPESNFNLISVTSLLTRNQLQVTFSHDKCVITDNNDLLFHIPRKGTLFQLETNPVRALSSSFPDTLSLITVGILQLSITNLKRTMIILINRH